MKIRAETTADAPHIRNLHIASFPDDGEANLVEKLRADGKIKISMVALIDQQIIAHVLFS